MGYKLAISELADSDIDEIVRYITEVLQNKPVAVHFMDELEKTYKYLSSNPFIYERSQILRLSRAGYRKAVVMNYVLMYLINEEEKIVNIARIFYGGRDYAKYL